MTRPTQRLALPIDAYLDRICGSSYLNLVVTATPGSGKTTRIPSHLAQCSSGLILCVEPRRLACVAAASRVASELDQPVGGFVGYHVRYEKKVSSGTKLCFVTTGMLLQYLSSDPFLERVSCVIFDEFHERAMESDVAMAMVLYLQREVRPNLRVVVMSATLDGARIGSYLGQCDVIDVDAPIYPLTIRYTRTPDSSRFGDYGALLVASCARALEETRGDVLVFLPGVGDIHAAMELARSQWGERHALVCCHASLSLEEQRQILHPEGARRRVIFSTNVSESSLTIPGVHAVVDSGFAKHKFFDSVCGLSRLETVRISRASSDQRAGRAARLAPGLCIRLWSEATHAQLTAFQTPEIERLDLSQAILNILAWNLEAPEALPWLSVPAPGRIDAARCLLERLGALDSEHEQLTELGRQMVRLPLEPRLARWMLAAAELDCLQDAALLAAWLSEAPYRRSLRGAYPSPDLYEDFVALKKNARTGVVQTVFRSARDILETARGLSPKRDKGAFGMSERQKLTQAMLLAFPDRLAKPRPQKEKYTASDPRRLSESVLALMSGNRGVMLKEAQTLRDAKFMICADVDLVRGRDHASNTIVKALEVDPKWIPWQEGIVARYEPDKDRVVVAQGVYFDIFTLRESFLHDAQYTELARRTLLKAALESPLKVMNFESDAWKQWAGRLAFVHALDPELEVPTFDEAWCRRMLPDLVKRADNFEALRAIDLTQVAHSHLPYETQSALQRLAPTRVKLDNGFETDVDYTLSPPVIRVKIQKAFGTHRLPYVGGGKVMVMIHLCAPNGRAAQVTQDIENFWRSTYADVRKLLRGRYPKHDWPEFPG